MWLILYGWLEDHHKELYNGQWDLVKHLFQWIPRPILWWGMTQHWFYWVYIRAQLASSKNHEGTSSTHKIDPLINHCFMLPHLYVLYVCWGATKHEFWGSSCVSRLVPPYVVGWPCETVTQSFHKSLCHVPSLEYIISTVGSCLPQIYCMSVYVFSSGRGWPRETVLIQLL